MIYLLIAILLNVILSVLFKLLPRFGVSTFQAVVVNYWVCAGMGLLHSWQDMNAVQLVAAPWMPGALFTGLGFICIFSLIGWCTRVDGITTTIIANKLSLIIPAIFSIFLYHESVGLFKIAGICLALPAVYLTTQNPQEKSNVGNNLTLPALLFIGSGLLDTWIKYAQAHFIHSTSDINLFSLCSFGIAAILGGAWLTIKLISRKARFHPRNLAAGLLIGIPNYYSIICLVRMLSSNFLQSSAMIPVFNIGIVVASSLSALLFFKEPSGRTRIIGLVLAVAAIVLIAFGG